MSSWKYIKNMGIIVIVLFIFVSLYRVSQLNISGAFLPKVIIENPPIPEDAQEKEENQNAGQATYPEKEVVEPETMPKIEMVFGGDVMMDSYIGDYIKDYGPDYPWEDIAPLIKDADISLVNLETSVSRKGATKKPKGFGFRSSPDTLEGLKNAGVDVVSVANNHILDFGEEAFFDTLNYLKEMDIKYVGGGKNLSDAERLVILDRQGIKVGIMAYTSIIPWDSWRASENKGGVASIQPEDYDRILDNIERASRECDILAVSLHWGSEYENTPHKWQVELAHSMIDKGADMIVGHHPHVLQGIELYKGKPILYSTGNLIFLKKEELAGKTGLFKLTFDKRGFKEGTFQPVNIKYCKANLLPTNEEAGREIVNMLRELSLDMGTNIDDKGRIR